MQWLISLDQALFRFCNDTLSNPFFDWLMPVLSGHNVPWLPAAIVGGVAVTFFGSVRLRVCALLMLLVVALGDPLIIGTIKQLVGRDRPCVELAETIVRLPCGGYRSFPSAHSANWFAMATVAFLFYRRSAWFMFPMAAAVAFSRVYCGVHFPADITAGAILGAGYAVALAVTAHGAWNFLGRKFFPAWHARLPNLLNPQPATAGAPLPAADKEWLHLGYLVIGVALIGRWLYLKSGVLQLSGDEAYQWIWSKHLALSYYSKPLGIAFLQKFGTLIGGDTEFGVRFGSPLIAAVMGFLLLRFLARETSARTAFWSLLAIFAVPILCVGSVLMTIDPPLVLGWMLAVLAGWRALQPDGRIRDWLLAGLALGGAFLFKYTAALQLVCWAIFFALLPAARAHLRKPGPWLALGAFALCTLPVVIWNAQNGWITVSHVATNAQLDRQWEPTLKFFGEFLGAEMFLLNPIFFIAMIWASFAFWRRRTEKPLWLFLACMGAPLFYGYWLYSLHSRVQPNWPAAAFPPMLLLAVLWLHERPLWAKRFFVGGLIIGLPVVILLHNTSLARFLIAPLPGDIDPAHRSYGWREAAAVVEKARQEFDPQAFVIAESYGTAGLYSFYSPTARAAVSSTTPQVYAFLGERATHQFYFWPKYDYRETRKGDNAIYVDLLQYYKPEKGWILKWLRREPINFRTTPVTSAPPAAMAAQFQSVTNLGVREVKIKDGRVFHRVQIFGCYGAK